MKPELYRQEYMKKLYKTLDQGDNSDTIKFFAQFSAGELPQSALKSFVKQAQLQRQRGKEEKEQVDAVLGNATGSHPEGRGRPNDPNGRYAIVSRQDPAAFRSGPDTPNYQFRFNMSNPAEQHNGRYILAAWAARNTVDAASYMIVDTEQWDRPTAVQQIWYEVTYTVNDGAQTSTHRVRTLAPNATAAMDQVRTNLQRQGQRVESINAEPVSGTAPTQSAESLPPGNARWRILDRNDQEVYSFINTTAQSDANQYARNWMISTASADVRGRGPFNIVPVT
jgi:hypothetical protein